MDRLLAESAITRTVYNFSYAEDTLDKSLMLSLFIPDQQFQLDNSSHLETPPVSYMPEKWWEQVYLALSGFTATQHFVGSPVITFAEEGKEKAHAMVNVIAYHCIEEEGGVLEEATARGRQEFDLEFWEGKWMIRRMVTKRDCPVGNFELYGKAAQRDKDGLGRKAVRFDLPTT